MSQGPILCVDDEPANLVVMRQILRDHHRLVFARSGAEALLAATKHLPSLILLDVDMPNMNGYDVCRLLKQDKLTENIPVIFVTGLSNERDEMAGFAAGGVDYITKPISTPVLRARLQTHLSLSRMAEARVRQVMYHDALTGLANGIAMKQRLTDLHASRADSRQFVACIRIDLDGLRNISDTVGYEVGDGLLIEAARRLAAVAGPENLAVRIGGDRFAVLCIGLNQAAAAELAACRAYRVAAFRCRSPR